MATRRYHFLFTTIFSFLVSTHVSAAALTADLATRLSQNVNRPVILILKHALTDQDAENDQQPLMEEFRQVKARRIKGFHLINAVAATVSDGEMARLMQNPLVAKVLPDRAIRLANPASVAPAIPQWSVNALIPHLIPDACGGNGRVLLEPEALQTTHTNSDTGGAPTARSLGLTGAGVKVAWMADGIDPQNINFLRADGTSVFVDYQDFSGDGAGAVTDGAEAFLDANAIAGQGIHTYDISKFGAQADPSACQVRIEGMAPGVQLVGLKVFSQNNASTQSGFLQAIEYAVNTAQVDVLNESFGANFFPDVTSQDILKQFNDAAVRAGVTVSVASGDAGSTNTIGTPATDPLVIAAGASTTYRFYAQTNYAAARYFATSGWLNDNITPLSSGGFTQTGKTLDLVAPGDLGFASCDSSATFKGCLDFLNHPSETEKSGGTSMAAPLTAGAAALVIEAYRQAHDGNSPSPATVKQILTSTATDLGVPAVEQGAGLLNTYKAALLAESIDDGRVPPSPRMVARKNLAEQPLLFSVNQLNAVGRAGSSHTWPVTVTNPSEIESDIRVAGRTFGPVEHVQTGVVTLDDASSPQFLDFAGVQNNYATFSFAVSSASADRLMASIAYPGNPAAGNDARVRLILVDPKGRFAAHSVPQGVGNYGSVDVRNPLPGIWTGVIFSEVASAKGTNGKIPWQVSTQAFVPFGSVSPSHFSLAPGASQTFYVTASTPLTPGDSAGSIAVTSSSGGTDPYVGSERSSIPVTLRTLVDLETGGGFRGILTGGNGRPESGGQTQYYQFNVRPGHQSLLANVSLTNDAGDMVGAYLINPDGIAVGFAQNGTSGKGSPSLTASTLSPSPGRWTLIVSIASVVGNEVAQAFEGSVQLDAIFATAPDLPNNSDALLPAGVPVTIPVSITNVGAGPQAIFIDARLDNRIDLPLAALGLASGFLGYPVPLPASANPPLWLVPTETSGLAAVATADVPIEFDYSPQFGGDPDLFGRPADGVGGTYAAKGSYTPTGGTVSPGYWTANPDELGPYPPAGAPPGLVNFQLTATTKAFDPTISSPTGDLWLTASDAGYQGLAPVIVGPGESKEIQVTLTPSGKSGTRVSGTLYVGASLSSLPPFGQTTGSELAAIPYTYTIQ